MAQQWFIRHREKAIGPISSQQLKSFAASGRIQPETKLSANANGPWKQAKQVRGLFPSSEASRPAKQPKSLDQHRRSVASADASARTPIAAGTPPVPNGLKQAEFVAEPSRKACPFCGEQIAFSAIKCRFCNEFLDGRQQAQQPTIVVAPKPSAGGVQTIEKTSKKWKAISLVAILTMMASAATFFVAIGIEEPGITALAAAIAIFAFLLYIFARVGAWWFHG